MSEELHTYPIAGVGWDRLRYPAVAPQTIINHNSPDAYYETV